MLATVSRVYDNLLSLHDSDPSAIPPTHCIRASSSSNLFSLASVHRRHVSPASCGSADPLIEKQLSCVASIVYYSAYYAFIESCGWCFTGLVLKDPRLYIPRNQYWAPRSKCNSDQNLLIPSNDKYRC